MKRSNIAALTLSLILGLVAANAVAAPQLISSRNTTVVSNEIIDIFNSSARVYSYTNEEKTQGAMGSATLIANDGKKLTFLSNAHVCRTEEFKSSEVELFEDGYSLGKFEIHVDLCVMDNSLNDDMAIFSIPIVAKIAHLRPMPIKPIELKKGDLIYTCGCDSGLWPNMQMGRVLDINNGIIEYNPPANPGDSGSGVFVIRDGQAYLVGLTAWRGFINGRWVGMAQPASQILDRVGEFLESLKGLPVPKKQKPDSYIPKEPRWDRPWFNRRFANLEDMAVENFHTINDLRDEIKNLIKGITEERAGFLRDENRRFDKFAAENKVALQSLQEQLEESEKNNDDLHQKIEELEAANRDWRIFRKRQDSEESIQWRLFRKDQESYAKKIEDEQKDLKDKFLEQFDSIKVIIRFLKLSVISLIVLMIASVFFGQAWASRAIATFVIGIYRVVKLFIELVSNAFSMPIKQTETPMDVVEDLRDQIEDGINETH